MPCLTHDPSIYLDEETLVELVENLSWRFRRNSDLRPLLNHLVGNRWQEFEGDLTQFWLCILQQTGGHEAAIDAAFAHCDAVDAAQIERLAALFLDSCLEVLPFHAAASFAELAERIANVLIEAMEPQDGADGVGTAVQRQVRLARAQEILKAGAIYR